ncbi:MAG: hypothetical protein VXX80_11000 [Bacteroidota bacterium]|nr:hypothetical protein [Bacteroidota bacterium]
MDTISKPRDQAFSPVHRQAKTNGASDPLPDIARKRETFDGKTQTSREEGKRREEKRIGVKKRRGEDNTTDTRRQEKSR